MRFQSESNNLIEFNHTLQGDGSSFGESVGRNGRMRDTLARRSDFTSRFPLNRMDVALNEAEEEARSERLRMGWGGGSTIGGSPHDGSVLSLEEVVRTVGRAIASP